MRVETVLSHIIELTRTKGLFELGSAVEAATVTLGLTLSIFLRPNLNINADHCNVGGFEVSQKK